MSTYDRPPRYIGYGTAGFRDCSDYLDVVFFRVGLVAAARSRYLNGQVIGVMVTASHNPPQDNGAKLIDPYGDMLERSWEPSVAAIANAQSHEECLQLVDKLYKEYSIPKDGKATVIIGSDTRASGPRLVECLTDGLKLANVAPDYYEHVTTPQLHYLVRAFNTEGGPESNPDKLPSFGTPTIKGYYEKASNALAEIIKSGDGKQEPVKITVDCANGVGAIQLEIMKPYLAKFANITLVNTDYKNPQMLNFECGADFVKTNQCLPKGIQPENNVLYASFDGDADRIVFYYMYDGKFCLLDGDKIATLAAQFAQKQTANLPGIGIGVVQTAYANGSSTNYITDQLNLDVVCTPTGVKHLHHAAQKFDIGIYFEANGHGTVLFKNSLIEKVKQNSDTESKNIVMFNDLINQTVGDAIADLLMVLAILQLTKMDAHTWDIQYTDLPNRLLKTKVQDRTIFKTTDAERKLVEPQGFQAKIDECVAKFEMGRSFVRASGTENVVRIYAEAKTTEQAVQLANDVTALVSSQYGPK